MLLHPLFQILLLTPRDPDFCDLDRLDHHALDVSADVTQGLEDKTQICRFTGMGLFAIEIQGEFFAPVDGTRIESLVKQLEESLALWQRGEELADICQRWLDGATARLDEAISGQDGSEQ